MTFKTPQLENALRLVGKRLDRDGFKGTVRLYVVGGAAGLLRGWLSGSRSTGDVDITESDPEASWEAVNRAAVEVAKEVGLPETWLNNASRMYAWCLPLGWKERCERARAYGPLEIWPLSQQDFIAAKVLSAPNRPQDLEDLLTIEPSAEELAFTEEHIDRLERESLDPDQSFEEARVILDVLRGCT